jgi:hypothetical protein
MSDTEAKTSCISFGKAERVPIALRDAKPLNSSLPTFFSLPGELRNQIYHLALEKSYQRVPLNPFYFNKPDPYIALLRSCSAVYDEARSYMVEQQIGYTPVLPGMDWSYGEPAEEYGLPKHTAVCILTDFMSVHFHLHIDLLCKADYDPEAVLASLAAALKMYMQHSWDIYLKHGLGKRRAVVHLDHLLSLWPKLFSSNNCIQLGALQHLVSLMAKDQMTDWEIRYYVGTGQAGKGIEYGNCSFPEIIRDTEIAQLRYYASMYDNISVMAEIYGENTAWEFGDKLKAVTRMRTPVTEFWPNVHFDVGRYEITAYDFYRHNYPGKSHQVMLARPILTKQ